MSIRVQLATDERKNAPGLLLQYRLDADLRGLRLPARAEPGPRDGLWQHTCFELFVGLQGDPAYREFNFSPSGQWAAYHFSQPRERDLATEAPVEPELNLQTHPDGLSLGVWLPRSALPASDATWELGLSAVIESTDGMLSYWALHHPGECPDFHHRDGWQPMHDLTALFQSDPSPT